MPRGGVHPCIIALIINCVGFAAFVTLGLVMYFDVYIASLYINNSLAPVTAVVNYHETIYREECERSTLKTSCVHYYEHYLNVTFTPNKYVYMNDTTTALVYLYNSYTSHVGYAPNTTIEGYYNICPFVPKSSYNAYYCELHGIATPFFLEKKTNTLAYAVSWSLISLAIVFLMIAITACMCLKAYPTKAKYDATFSAC